MQYSLYIGSISQTFSARDKYRREVQGLLVNTTSLVVFGLKVFLIIVECIRIQFSRHLRELTFITEAENLVKSVCSKSFSFFAKLAAPISQFTFCMLAIIFALLHPSVVFVPLIPFLILSFFTDLKSRQSCTLFSLSKRLFLLLAVTFTGALYMYHLV